jgi:hypothetical protein
MYLRSEFFDMLTLKIFKVLVQFLSKCSGRSNLARCLNVLSRRLMIFFDRMTRLSRYPSYPEQMPISYVRKESRPLPCRLFVWATGKGTCISACLCVSLSRQWKQRITVNCFAFMLHANASCLICWYTVNSFRMTETIYNCSNSRSD